MQSNPFLRVPKVITTKRPLSGILSQHSMLILDILVWILRHKLHSTDILSINLMTRSWAFQSPFFVGWRIHGKLPFTPKYKMFALSYSMPHKDSFGLKKDGGLHALIGS